LILDQLLFGGKLDSKSYGAFRETRVWPSSAETDWFAPIVRHYDIYQNQTSFGFEGGNRLCGRT